MNRYGLIFGQSSLGSVCRESLWLSAAGIRFFGGGLGSVGATGGEEVAAATGLTARLKLPIGRQIAGSRLAREEQRAQISTETRSHFWDVSLSLFGANG